MKPRIGSLFSGYGGLDLAVGSVLGGETVFVADVCGDPKSKHWPHRSPCKSPCTILAHRFPGVPNLGDVAAIDWTPRVGLVDVLCAGFPCQDVSTAGKRAGLMGGTRSGLWSEVVRAIVALNPRLVVLENVPGIFTAPAAGDVEPCTVCLGGRPDQHLRALHAVLADLAEIGFDAEWICVPASGVGAPHKRLRWFLAAYPAGQPWSIDDRDGEPAADAACDGRDEGRGHAFSDDGPEGGGRPSDAIRAHPEWNGLTLLPSPRTSDTNGAGAHGDGGPDLRTAVTLLPTPMSARSGRNRSASDGAAVRPSLDQVDRLLPTPRASDGPDASSHGRTWSKTDRSLHTLVHTGELLPTPSVADVQGGRKGRSGDRAGELLLNGIASEQRFGEYAPAIARWEQVIGRPAPAPTEPTGRNGAHRLSPRFTEFLMGLADGWITDVPGITRNEALKACGNGVVPQQAVAALCILLARISAIASEHAA